MTRNQFKYNQTKLAEVPHGESFFVYDVETYPDDENRDCILYSIRIFPLTKLSKSTVYRELTESEIIQIKRRS